MSRRLTRGQARVQRRASYWQQRMAAAAGPAARAAVAFDWARARITDLPRARQDAAWQEVADLLSTVAAPERSSHVNSHEEPGRKSASTHRPARARARPPYSQ
jgi:hypothetical protein